MTKRIVFRRAKGLIQIGSYTHDTVDMVFTEEEMKIGSSHASDVADVTVYEPGYSFETIETGSLGQGSVTFYLLNDVRLGLEQMLKGRPDEGVDIIHPHFYGPHGEHLKISVKTFSWFKKKDPDTWMLVPLAQFKEPTVDVHIACQRISLNMVRILGFIREKRLEDVGVPVGPIVDEPYESGRYQYKDNIAIVKLNDLWPIKCFDAEFKSGHRCMNLECEKKEHCLIDKSDWIDQSNEPYPFDGRSIFDDVDPCDL